MARQKGSEGGAAQALLGGTAARSRVRQHDVTWNCARSPRFLVCSSFHTAPRQGQPPWSSGGSERVSLRCPGRGPGRLAPLPKGMHASPTLLGGAAAAKPGVAAERPLCPAQPPGSGPEVWAVTIGARGALRPPQPQGAAAAAIPVAAATTRSAPSTRVPCPVVQASAGLTAPRPGALVGRGRWRNGGARGWGVAHRAVHLCGARHAACRCFALPCWTFLLPPAGTCFGIPSHRAAASPAVQVEGAPLPSQDEAELIRQAKKQLQLHKQATQRLSRWLRRGWGEHAAKGLALCTRAQAAWWMLLGVPRLCPHQEAHAHCPPPADWRRERWRTACCIPGMARPRLCTAWARCCGARGRLEGPRALRAVAQHAAVDAACRWLRCCMCLCASATALTPPCGRAPQAERQAHAHRNGGIPQPENRG